MAVAGAGLLVVPGSSAVAAAHPAAGADTTTATLVNLTIASVPALGQTAFHGTYGTGGDLSQDPDGVLKRLTISGSPLSKTHSDAARNSAQAQATVAYSPSGKQLYNVASMDADAECTTSPSGPSASAFVHTGASGVTVLGTGAPEGKTTTVAVTGAQLGAAGVDHGSVSLKYTVTATPGPQTTGVSTARAHMDLVLTGVFYDAAGKELYNGQLQTARFGDVTATCDATTPSPSGGPTTNPTGAPSPTGPADPASPPGPTAPGAATPSTGPSTAPAAAVGPATATAVAAPAPTGAVPPGAAATSASSSSRHMHRDVHPHGTGKGTTAKPENGPMQVAGQAAPMSSPGGGTSRWWIALSAVGLGAGVLVFFATRRRGRHQ